MKPEQLEIERLRREVIKLKAERDILKNATKKLSRASWVRNRRDVHEPRQIANKICARRKRQ